MTCVESMSSYSGVFAPVDWLSSDLEEHWTMMWQRLKSYWMSLVLLSATTLLWSGCSGLPGGGGGGVTNPDQAFQGSFESSPKSGQASQDYEVKTITFANDGSFKVYRTKAKLTAETPDITGTYEVIDKDIVFKNPDGEEFEERGRFLDDNKTRFEWALFTIDVFEKKSAD